MLNKLWLCHNINKFYHIFGEDIGVVPTHTKLRDLNNPDFLLGVQFDIKEALEGYEDCFCEDAYETSIWLDKMYEQIATLRETPKHKFHWEIVVPTVALILVTLFTIYQVVISKPVEVSEVHTRYTAYGRYYTDGTVITNDGNEWSYSTDTISDQTPYDNMPVWVGFDDNGTSDNITDDIILDIVYDRETAIYDRLETALSDKFELERKDNNIRIQTIKKSVE